MGTIRLLLAVLVAFGHLSQPDPTTRWWTASAAIFAVKAFFVLSGFYMALVLDTGYRSRPVSDFYLSRALRLLPAYWFVSAVTWLVVWQFAGAGNFSPLLNPLVAWRGVEPDHWSVPVLGYVALSLTTLLGADTWMWLGFGAAGGPWSVAPAYSRGATSALALSFVPQAWTLGLELLFYLLVPFLAARRTWVLVLLGIGSLMFRFALAQHGLAGEPWSRALFPSELIYFLGGLLAYRLYLIARPSRIPQVVLWTVFIAMLAISLSIAPYAITYGSDARLITTVPFVLLVLALPFMFKLTRGQRVDSFLGNLAYPVYLVHLLIYGVVGSTPIKAGITNHLGDGWGWLLANLTLVLLGAYVVERMAVRPVDRIRVRFGARGLAQRSAETVTTETGRRELADVRRLS